MTLEEHRAKIEGTKNELRALLPKAETDEERAKVNEIAARLDTEEADLKAAEKWSEDQARLQERLQPALIDTAPRVQTRESDQALDPEVRNRGQIVLTREFIGDMLATREVRQSWDDVYRHRTRTKVDEENTKALLRMDAAEPYYTPSQEYRQAVEGLQARTINTDLTTGTTSDALGGYLIPPDTAAYALLQLRMQAFMGVEREAMVLNHANDRNFPVPQLDRVSEAGESRDEGELATTQGDFALTQVVLGSKRISSKFLLVPAAVLRSFAVEAEPLIMALLAESVGRRKGAVYATGNGTDPNPTGIHTGLVAAYTHTLSVKYDRSDGFWTKGATGGTNNTNDGAEIPIEMLEQLDSAYWGIGSTVVMHPAFYQAMRRVKDAEGRYMWPELAMRSVSADGTFMWQGLRCCLDPNYTDPVLGTSDTNKYVATIGDHKGFFIRNVAGMRLSRNPWALDLGDAVRFVIHAYTDSNVVHPWGLQKIGITVQD